MFKKWFGKDKQDSTPQAPEVMGLRLGGAFELDTLRLRLIEPHLIVEGVAKTQFIQAVGEVKLDESTTVLRFYTDDEGFLEVLLTGGVSEEHISDVKLWYFYDTQDVADAKNWNLMLKNDIAKPRYSLDDYEFEQVWKSAGESKPVAVTEKTYHNDGKQSQTDQFLMLYERCADTELYEYALVSGEEKIIDNHADRCLVRSSGFDIMAADITIIG